MFEVITQLFSITKPLGYSQDEINKVKEIFGSIPKTLEDFYLQYGKSEELQGLQDSLILPTKYDLFCEPKFSDYMIFFNENQGVCKAGIHRDDLQNPNPPVYVGEDLGKGTKWYKSADVLSDFLIAMYGYQASICLEFSPENFFFVEDSEVSVIEKRFVKQKEELNRWLSCKITLYANDNNSRIALMKHIDFKYNTQMNYAANNEKSFEEMSLFLKDTGESI